MRNRCASAEADVLVAKVCDTLAEVKHSAKVSYLLGLNPRARRRGWLPTELEGA